MSSQRHKLEQYNTTVLGELNAEGTVAPALLASGSAFVIAIYPPGGPLSGSSVTGAIPQSIAPPVVIPPVLSSLAPASTTVNGPDLMVHAVGTGFKADSVINFAGAPVTTLFNSETDLGFTVSPTAHVAGPVDVYVVNAGGVNSDILPFDFTLARGAKR